MRAVAALLLVLWTFGYSSAPSAAVPATMTYQGFLTSASGQPANGSMLMAFKIYTTNVGGTSLWGEIQNVQVTNGTYTVTLGSVSALNLPFDVPYFLGVAVSPDPEMTPRHPLTSAPYSMRAKYADSVTGGTVVSTVTRTASDSSGVGSVSCQSGEILVGGGCDCMGSRSAGTNYGVVFGCTPSGQSFIGGCYDFLYSSAYGPSPIRVRAICMSGITVGMDAPKAEDSLNAALEDLRARREQMRSLQ